jgi:hypothetical protein
MSFFLRMAVRRMAICAGNARPGAQERDQITPRTQPRSGFFARPNRIVGATVNKLLLAVGVVQHGHLQTETAMQNNLQFILQLLAATSNGNMPESRLLQRYGMRFRRSTFDDALGDLIDAGMVERVPPLHVKLK